MSKLIIREGLFYKTRDGRKVGPMRDCSKDPGEYLDGDLDGGEYCFQPDGGYRFYDRHLDLIAEWTDAPASPVRTVTRKEIVPGTYGRVALLLEGDGFVNVAITRFLTESPPEVDAPFRMMSAAELRAAAKVFTDLADALDEQGGAS